MVFKYEHRTDRQKWSSESMQKGVEAVSNGQMGYYHASLNFGVNMEERLFGLTMLECRHLAFQLADFNDCTHSFNKNLELAGKDWMQWFLRRHSDVSTRTPLATFRPRAMGFNRVAVATKGKRQVGALTSRERRETVTVKIWLLATGAYMPFIDGIVPRRWVQSNPGRIVTLQQSTKLFSEAYLKAVTMLTTINGFKKIGVWPFDINVFADADFLPSSTTDIQTIEVQHIPEETEAISVNPKIKETTPEPESELSFDNSKPGPSNDHETSLKFVSP
ncbi:hypothetical protein ILUMI_10793 [Ignelater luminosus]|uniref:Uncharacterized protein n=1 Tax=Ignelater luminosus TaxID=2038154 RepID=A0A8K0GDU5_IGNLU|nr:hypothetical protein ILUMI_10793 [Ignelater luminosus]